MPTITSVGATKSGGYTGMGDFLANLLDSGVMGFNKYQKEQEDKKNGNDELIKAGISSKTMRPAKDGEKGDFTDSSGRSWVYDDANLKSEHEQTTKLRQGQMWQSLTDQSYTAAQRNGLQYGTPEYNQFVKQYMAQALGSPSGKFDDETQSRIEDTYGNQAISYMQGLDASSKTTNPKGITYTPQMFMQNASPLASVLSGLGSGPQGTPGRTYSPSPNVQDPILGPMFSGPTPMGNAGGNNRSPGNIDPQMAALMNIMAMHNGIGAPPLMPGSNPYAINGTTPAGPVDLSQG